MDMDDYLKYEGLVFIIIVSILMLLQMYLTPLELDGFCIRPADDFNLIVIYGEYDVHIRDGIEYHCPVLPQFPFRKLLPNSSGKV